MRVAALRKWVLPIIAAALALYVASRPANPVEVVEPEQARGTDKQGNAYDMRRDSGEVREFIVRFKEKL